MYNVPVEAWLQRGGRRHGLGEHGFFLRGLCRYGSRKKRKGGDFIRNQFPLLADVPWEGLIAVEMILA